MKHRGALYSDDEAVRKGTLQILDAGANVFQIFQRGSEAEHVRFLLDAFNPPAGGLVLDAGCGVGAVSRIMRGLRPDLDFLLLNISKAQLDLCPEFPKLQGDIQAIPLADGSMDAVMACYVLGHADLDLAMGEMLRVLKPGGVLFVHDLQAGREIPELDYMAHSFAGWPKWTPAGMNTDSFSKFLPDFGHLFPDVRPVVVRVVKQ